MPGIKYSPCPVNEQFVIQRFQGFTKCDSLDETASDSQVTHAGFTREDHRCAVNEDVAVHVALSYIGAVFST